MSNRTLQAIKFNKDQVSLDILDQLLLPYSTVYIPIRSIEDAYQAIKLMQVRGAPAIAIVGAFAITVETFGYVKNNINGRITIGQLTDKIDYLVTSRPTAVNLSNACDDIKNLLVLQFQSTDKVSESTFKSILDYSVKLYEDDLSNNFKIGENGLKYIIETLTSQQFKGPFSIMTICNTGSLATSGHGTALGIIRTVYQKLSKEAADADGKPLDFWLDHVYPCETRPYNQGAKLTTYELNYENIPFTLICDNMVSSLIGSLNDKKKAIKQVNAPIKFIIAGADRIVKNGDSANKIGTYQLSTIANYFNTNKLNEGKNKIKFIIAAPRTTIDLKTETGDAIVIEERPGKELTSLNGPVLASNGTVGDKLTVGIATPGISVWNPAFDVTPHELIDCIVTEDLPILKDQLGNFNLG